jgi:energy-coupling factor transporter ATP-binding protein EcfA2
MGTPYVSTGFLMINDIEIRNFRCYEHLKIPSCRRLNLMVGDSGSGKTALLEAIFLALGQSTDLPLRFRQNRGLGGTFTGSSRQIEEGIFGGLFYRWDTQRTISVILNGSGPETRTVMMTRAPAEVTLAFPPEHDAVVRTAAPIQFVWTNSEGHRFVVQPILTPQGMVLASTNEDLPDFFLFGANTAYTSDETAGRFSLISRAGRAADFVKSLITDYKWINGLSIEVLAGAPVLYASLVGRKELIPINDVSSGINKMVSIAAAIASRERSVVLVDEIENGIYYKHLPALWTNILAFVRTYESQMFISTHSGECIEALVTAAKDKVDDIALWRIERDEDGSRVLKQFSGDTLRAGLERGGEVR